MKATMLPPAGDSSTMSAHSLTAAPSRVRWPRARHHQVSIALLAIILAISWVISVGVSYTLADVPADQISGLVQGKNKVGIEILLEAWGAHPSANVVEFEAVDSVRTDAGGGFHFTVERRQGQAATQAAGMSFRGWAVRVASGQCGGVGLRLPAMRMRDNCEAGWLIRPWQTATLNANAAVTFSIATTGSTAPVPPAAVATATSEPVTTLPLPSPTPPRIGASPPPAWTVTEIPPSGPAPEHPSDLPTVVASAGSNAALPTATTIALPATSEPSSTPVDVNSSVAETSPTALAVASAPPPSVTLVPFIIDSHPPVNAPTVPPGSGTDGQTILAANPTATAGLVVAEAPPPATAASAPATNSGSGSFNILAWALIAIALFVGLIIILRVINRLRWRKRHREESAYDDDAPPIPMPNPAAYGSVEDTPEGAAFHLPPPGAQYGPNRPTLAQPRRGAGQGRTEQG
ncbi:MAG: hypothetical protein DLM69_09025 [Candidatus Chloroheliales bacterium]|nr:MAG: hypothetical protein DLM69_09025 [Chloroflexota bacterium]